MSTSRPFSKDTEENLIVFLFVVRICHATNFLHLQSPDGIRPLVDYEGGSQVSSLI